MAGFRRDVSIAALFSAALAMPAFGDEDQEDGVVYEGEDGALEVTVYPPKKKRDRASCRSCGTITVYVPPPGMIGKVQIKPDKKGSREDRRKLEQCESILEEIGQQSEELALVRVKMISNDELDDAVVDAARLNLTNMRLEMLNEALTQWKESGCADLLGTEIATATNDAYYTYGAN